MSAKTIAAFKAFRSAHGASVFEAPAVSVTGVSRLRVGAQKRNHPTAPPPSAASMADQLDVQASGKERAAHRLMAEAEELRAAARAYRRIERANGL